MSDFDYAPLGQRLARPSGIVELMEDLGDALAGDAETPMRMMGGGNPAHIPAMLQLWRRRMAELAANEPLCDRVLANYDPPAGNAAFRRAVARCLRDAYGWDVGIENVAVTPGGQAAFFFLFNLLAGPTPQGPRQIVFPLTPEYIGYADQGLQAGMFASFRPRIEQDGDRTFKYRIDFDALRLDQRAAAICVSRPTNPTGNVLTDDEVARLRQLAAERQIPLVIDNAYGAPFPHALFVDIRPQWDRDVVLTLSLSKLGLPGTRTGIVVADAPLVRRIAAMTAIVGLANGNVGQALVQPLLESGELLELSQQVIRPFYQRKSELALRLLHEHFRDDFPWAVHRSEGAFFLWLWLPELPIAARELYERLKRRGVLVVPGEYFFFGLPPEDDDWPHRRQCLRVTFSQAEETVAAGIEIMADELRRLHASRGSTESASGSGP